MKKLSLILLALLPLAACKAPQSPVTAVSPIIGTAADGNVYPGAVAPFGLVQLSPDTRLESASGYNYADSVILGFSHTHLSGTGEGDLGDFLFLPALGDPAPLPFSHDGELAYAGYYRVSLPGISAELTALPHVGVHRYSFYGEGERNLLIDLKHKVGRGTAFDLDFKCLADTLVRGSHVTSGWAARREAYFEAAFSAPILECKPYGEGKYLLSFGSDIKELCVAVGISTVSCENAHKNRLAEAPVADFDAASGAALELWDKALEKVHLEGGSPQQRQVFYTALYRSMIVPNRMDGGERFTSPLSLWDTFRSWNPLMTLLEPDLVNDMVQDMLAMYDRDGKLPVWALWGQDIDCMIGYHAVSVIADAWMRGIRGFDGEKALQAMLASSNLDPASQWYNDYGYIPSDFTPQAVSKTLEFAYDDWCIARMAQALGHQELADSYDERARRYRALFDPSTGFFRGKESDGNWRTPFNPDQHSRDYTEATAWQYRHFVPHDMAGFASLMGSPEAARASLDTLFNYDYTDPEMAGSWMVTGRIGKYAHGNEPSHATAWMYAALGDPSSSQRRVREILEKQHSTGPDGLCGNEDCGQMSAWYVLSALGIYPLCPGSGEYVLGAPLFPKATLTLGNGKQLTITADHPEYPYVKDVTFNGERVESLFVRYEDMMEGGELHFTLSRKPCHERDDLFPPYSLSAGIPMASTPILEGDPRFFDGAFEVRLSSRTPGAGIRYTLDGSTPTEASALYKGPFTIEKDCILCARAFKEDFAPSPLLRLHAFPLEYLPPVSPASALSPGCRYTYHKGVFKTCADVLASPVASQGIMPAPSIDAAPDEDHFAYVFEGFLDIPEDGLWEFALRSDDGSVLYIDNCLTVNNDGSHSDYTANGYIALLKGLHPFRLIYFEDFEGQAFGWQWKRPGAGDFEPITNIKL